MSTGLDQRMTTPIVVVTGFVTAFAATFLYFWTGTGGGLPADGDPYRVSFTAGDVEDLIDRGDVSISGVKVGHAYIDGPEGEGARVTLELEEAAPLHEGASVRVGVKSLIGTSYVDVVDGHGEPLPDGATLPASAVAPAAGIDELIETLDPETRKALNGTVRSLGAATKGRSEDVSRLLTGLGALGREGHTAMDAIAAQSQDLSSLARETTKLLNALDSGQGRIIDVVRDAERLTRATSGQRGALEDTMRALPGVLDSAGAATADLDDLSTSLAPVAADLRRAAPDLNKALLRLPAVSNDLRGLMPSLDATLTAAPATLERVPAFGADLRGLIPEAQVMLRDVNPMLSYLEPYGRDVGSFFANWGSAMDMSLPNGIRALRLAMIFNQNTLGGKPVPLDLSPFYWTNAYPAAGQGSHPAPFTGDYPRVPRDPE